MQKASSIWPHSGEQLCSILYLNSFDRSASIRDYPPYPAFGDVLQWLDQIKLAPPVLASSNGSLADVQSGHIPEASNLRTRLASSLLYTCANLNCIEPYCATHSE